MPISRVPTTTQMVVLLLPKVVSSSSSAAPHSRRRRGISYRPPRRRPLVGFFASSDGVGDGVSSSFPSPCGIIIIQSHLLSCVPVAFFTSAAISPSPRRFYAPHIAGLEV